MYFRNVLVVDDKVTTQAPVLKKLKASSRPSRTLSLSMEGLNLQNSEVEVKTNHIWNISTRWFRSCLPSPKSSLSLRVAKSLERSEQTIKPLVKKPVTSSETKPMPSDKVSIQVLPHLVVLRFPVFHLLLKKILSKFNPHLILLRSVKFAKKKRTIKSVWVVTQFVNYYFW